MKKILIAGSGSYIGTSLETYLKKWPDEFQIDTVDMIGDDWRTADFSGYDAIFHVAGIVHQPKSKDDPCQLEFYKRVNTHLAVETAEKAKAQGVRQFIFMSTAGVYGVETPIGKSVIITRDTPLCPKDNYGISKLLAEQQLQPLADENFTLAILRPPMIYGKGCKGNYVTLAKLARKLPVFPYVDNYRSMLHIDNLCEFVRLIVVNNDGGVFWPQNKEYVNTTDMVVKIAKTHGKKIVVLRGVQCLLKPLSYVTKLVNKAFGSFCYDQSLSVYNQDYCIRGFSESIQETEL